jgi:hypothetical protein
MMTRSDFGWWAVPLGRIVCILPSGAIGFIIGSVGFREFGITPIGGGAPA